MSVDLEQLKRIHRIDNELEEATKAVKTVQEARASLIVDLPEYQALEEALTAVKVCRERLKMALSNNSELNKLEVELGEAKYHKRDLAEILSLHLVAYHEETGRDVVKDRDGYNHQIELRARKGKRALDQPRLPLGISRHLGQHVEIPAPAEKVGA